LIVDNYATHEHPKVRAWLERQRLSTSGRYSSGGTATPMPLMTGSTMEVLGRSLSITSLPEPLAKPKHVLHSL
jgi:hypothetical protein